MSGPDGLWLDRIRRSRAWLSTLIVFLFSFLFFLLFCEIVENIVEFLVWLNRRYIFASHKDAESLGYNQFSEEDSAFDLLHSFDQLFISKIRVHIQTKPGLCGTEILPGES